MITVKWHKNPNYQNYYNGDVLINGEKASTVRIIAGGWMIEKGERKTKATERFTKWLISGNGDPLYYSIALMDYLFDLWKETNPALYRSQREIVLKHATGLIESEKRKLNTRSTGAYLASSTISVDMSSYFADNIMRLETELNTFVNRHSEGSL